MTDYLHSYFTQADDATLGTDPVAGTHAGYWRVDDDTETNIAGHSIEIINPAGTRIINACTAGGTALNTQDIEAGLFAMLDYSAGIAGPLFDFDLTPVTGLKFLRWTLVHSTGAYNVSDTGNMLWQGGQGFGPMPLAISGNYDGNQSIRLCVFVRSVAGAAAAKTANVEWWIQAPWLTGFDARSNRWFMAYSETFTVGTYKAGLMFKTYASTATININELRFGVGTFDPADNLGSSHICNSALGAGVVYHNIIKAGETYVASVSTGEAEGLANKHDVRLFRSEDLHIWTEVGDPWMESGGAGAGFCYDAAGLISYGNTIVAGAERYSRADTTAWDIVIRTSADGGLTWTDDLVVLSATSASAPTLQLTRNGLRTNQGRWMFFVGENPGSYLHVIYSDVAVPDEAGDWSDKDLTASGTFGNEINGWLRTDGKVFLAARTGSHYARYMILDDVDVAITVDTIALADGLSGRPLIHQSKGGDPIGNYPYAVGEKLYMIGVESSDARRRQSHILLVSDDDGVSWEVSDSSPLLISPGSDDIEAPSMVADGYDIISSLSLNREDAYVLKHPWALVRDLTSDDIIVHRVAHTNAPMIPYN